MMRIRSMPFGCRIITDPAIRSPVGKRVFRTPLLVVFCVSLLTGQQDTGMITGLVTDASNAPVSGAAVSVINRNTNVRTGVTTGSDGIYVATPLKIGAYGVQVEVTGFKKVVREGIQLQVQDRLRIDFKLEVGDVTQTVEVSAQAPLLQSESTSLGQVIDKRSVADLPLNGRNFTQLIVLAPGAYIPQRNNSLYRSLLVGINGNRVQNNNFMLDGINNNTTDNNNTTIIPSPDAIAEFKVQTNLLPAEFGRSLGGTININIKSGTNEFHGSAFEFLRNSELDANAFFNSGRSKPPFQQNQFGFALGGPVVIPKVYNGRNRTFIFGDYQGTRIRKGLTRIFTVPTAPVRAGDFSGGATVYDPESTRPGAAGGFVRDPLPNNRVPAGRLDPVTQRYLALYPLPNQTTTANNLIVNPKFIDDKDQGDIKVDHNFSAKDSMFVRYSIGDETQITPLNLPGILSGGYFNAIEFLPQLFRTGGAVLSHTHSFSPHVINEFRIGYNRLFGTVGTLSGGKNLSKEFGISGVPDDPQANGLAVSSVAGFSALGDAFDRRNGQNVFHVLDNFTVVHGRHLFKAGFDHRRTGLNVNQGSSPRGNFSYTGVYSQNPVCRAGTGNAMADLLLGYPDTAVIGSVVHSGIRIRNYSAFFQDDWKAGPRLTLNLGVRYEYTTPVTEVANRIVNFDLGANNIILAKPGNLKDRALANGDFNNFAPRVGVAFQATPKTVIRTGYGMFYTLEDAGHHNPQFNPPFLVTRTFVSDQLNPGASPRPRNGFPPLAPGNDLRNQFLNVNGRPYDFPAAYSQQWNFNVEREIGGILLEAAYVGNKSTKLMGARNINQPLPGPGVLNSRRIFPGWGNITYQETRGKSIYHGLQMKAEKRFSEGGTLLVSYSFARAIDDSDSTQLVFDGGTANPQDQRNARLERALSFQDVRHRLVSSYVYELPFGKGRKFMTSSGRAANLVIGGWQVNGITSLQGGRPFTVSSSFDHSNTGSSNIRPDSSGTGALLKRDQRSVTRFFDTSAFRLPAGFAFGNLGRNTGTSPGQVNFDFAAFKNFPVGGERGRIVQFRAELFNIMNTPQYATPNRIFGTPQFGSITDVISDNRDVQMGLKFIW